MRSTINQFISLGLGAAIASKDQIEKTIEDLVKKGEVSKAESKELIENLIEKGAQTKLELDALVQLKVKEALNQLQLVTKDEVMILEKRIEELERRK